MAKRLRGERQAEATAAVRKDPQRSKAERKRRQNLLITWSIIAVAAVCAVAILYALIPKPSPYVGFAKCLSAQGAVMHGTDWCTHCQSQKRKFGQAFKYVAWVNCDYSSLCEERNVTGYPTWIFTDGSRLEGEQPLSALAAKTGCALP